MSFTRITRRDSHRPRIQVDRTSGDSTPTDIELHRLRAPPVLRRQLHKTEQILESFSFAIVGWPRNGSKSMSV